MQLTKNVDIYKLNINKYNKILVLNIKISTILNFFFLKINNIFI